MGSDDGCTEIPEMYQNVIVMRHGDRLDNVDPSWILSSPRPWDPPLHERGKERAFAAGRTIRDQIGFPIHRVFVSPFIRCLETAHEVVAALSAVADCSNHASDGASRSVVIDPSKIKVSIENGLCEMMNYIAIRRNVSPEDGIFSFDLSECRKALPRGTVDDAYEQVYKELPKWQETVDCARTRYLRVIKALADKYPVENLLLVTHGEGVGCAVSEFVKNVDMVCEAEYCSYAHLSRPVFSSSSKPFTAGDFVGLPQDQVGLKWIFFNQELDGSAQKFA